MSYHKIVVVIPIKDTGEFLMVRHPNRGWEFPGGKIEEGETVEEAALRECFEEAGAKIDDLRYLGKEGKTVFLSALVVDLLPTHEFERAFFMELPENLSFPKDEAEKYLKRAFSNY